jgi:hypothetical protein
LTLFDPDAEAADLLRTGEVMRGREAILRAWTARFDEAHAEAIVADVIEIDDTVLAAICFQTYTPEFAAVGAPFVVASRFTFREDRIVRLEHTPFNEIRDDVKALFHVV